MSMNENDISQEFVYNFPSDRIYGVIIWTGTEWTGYYSTVKNNVCDFIDGKNLFENCSSRCRFVEYSRYLVDGKLVVCKIIKEKGE